MRTTIAKPAQRQMADAGYSAGSSTRREGAVRASLALGSESRASQAVQRLQDRAAAGRQAEAAGALQAKADQSLQRMGGEDEELMQGRFGPDAMQRQGSDEEELMQGRFAGSAAAIQRAAALQREAAPGPGGLPAGLQSGISALSGQDVSDVRVHYNSAAPASVGALAYAQGSDIHLGPGQEQHLPHEAWHTVQQRQGRVPVTGSVAGQPLNDDPSLEAEADRMGQQALSAGAQQQKQDAGES